MEEIDKKVSVGDWVFTIIILSIPFINFGFALYWALSDNARKTKRNYARAWFIVTGILFLFYILVSFLSTGGGSSQEIQVLHTHVMGLL